MLPQSHHVSTTPETAVLSSRRNPLGQGDPRPHPGDGLLDDLPPEEREVMILASFYGLAKDEIAAVIGASVEMADSLFRRATEHLRRRLTGPTAA